MRYLYDNSRVDAEWSTLDARGYSWWAHDLAQQIWSEPGLDDDGIEIYRVVARTPMVRDVADPEAAAALLDAFNGLSVGSALVLDEADGSVGLVASMWAHEQNVEWVARGSQIRDVGDAPHRHRVWQREHGDSAPRDVRPPERSPD